MRSQCVALSFAAALFLAALVSPAIANISISGQVGPDGLNRIEGTVWDPQRQPVPDLYVELMDSVDGNLSRTRTSGSGRFTFFGLSTGRFRVKVVTAGTNYLEAVQDVEILGTALQNSSETQYVEFYLKLDPRKAAAASGGPAEAVFVQEIPDEARKLYKKGASAIKTDAGIQSVEKAIEVFPTYFDALAAAGKEYVDRGQYVKGARYLIQAIDVNKRSYSSYGSLAYAAYKLNKIPEATKAAIEAVTLEPRAINSRVLLGRLFRIQGNYKTAEDVLVETKKFAPSAPAVYYELALLFNRQDRNTEAAAELATYLKLAPDGENKKEVEELIAKLKSAPSK
jgi:tetratricopeptide (TPR) repeat protein